MKSGVIHANFIHSSQRFDPSYHLSDAIYFTEELERLPFEKVAISDAAENVFLGNIFSRVFVKDACNGVPYLAASDTVLADLDTGRFLSYKQASYLSYQSLKKNLILITCSCTIGNVTYTNSTFENHIATHDLIRIIPNDQKILRGYLYAFLSSKFGCNQLIRLKFGGVVKHINADHIKNIMIPCFPEDFQNKVDNLIQQSSKLREEAEDILCRADKLLKKESELADLTPDDYDYFGPRGQKRQVSCFIRNRKDISSTTINAFNLSERIRKTKLSIRCMTKPLKDVLLGGSTFSTGSFPRVEVKEGHGIMLINQKDIFDTIVKGKFISKQGVKTDNMVEYGEVIVAGVGTLGESESFCRVIFANEDMKGQLISGEFIRMKTNNEVPSGYLYSWLASDYGFRFLRNLQAGTKLCRPIPKLALELPVPILPTSIMNEIDRLVKEAHTKRHQANNCERDAIKIVEDEIEKWNK